MSSDTRPGQLVSGPWRPPRRGDGDGTGHEPSTMALAAERAVQQAIKEQNRGAHRLWVDFFGVTPPRNPLHCSCEHTPPRHRRVSLAGRANGRRIGPTH
eukprot:5442040-Prymnesium_polylepis.1